MSEHTLDVSFDVSNTGREMSAEPVCHIKFQVN